MKCAKPKKHTRQQSNDDSIVSNGSIELEDLSLNEVDSASNTSSDRPYFGHRYTHSTASSTGRPGQSSRLSSSNSSYAFILPNLDAFGTDFRRFLEKDMIEVSVLRRLENSGHLNWWCTMDSTQSQKLFPLSTTGDGNCLLHAASLGIWGVHDSQLALRNAVWNILTNNLKKEAILRRWRWAETKNNLQSGLVLSEHEWEKEWKEVVDIASSKPRRSKSIEIKEINKEDEIKEIDVSEGEEEQPPTPASSGDSDELIFESLETVHVFALANVLRRPIIVVSDTILRNAAGEELSPINFGGIYLPLEWPAEMCHRSPLVLCYDSSHFSPLVAMKQQSTSNSNLQAIPITDKNRNLLPVHFSIDPGRQYEWSETPSDMSIKKEGESYQSIDHQINLIGQYMDIVKMDLRKGSKKKSVPISNGTVGIPDKLLTLAAGSSHSNYELKTSSTSNQQSHSRIFKEIYQQIIKLGRFRSKKNKQVKKEQKPVKIKASELRQSNCVLTVLLHNYVHQHSDLMVNIYIESAKERYAEWKKSQHLGGLTSNYGTISRSRISRSFSLTTAALTCINAYCNQVSTPSYNFLCAECFELQKKELMENGEDINKNTHIHRPASMSSSQEENVSICTESESPHPTPTFYTSEPAPIYKLPPAGVLKNCHEEEHHNSFNKPLETFAAGY
uniref:OTU domain-containing protein n=1 Tax=Rhabditophanes sp. KR3021 TaxID=114890 RepID=A0AC35TFL5_9BILA